MREGARPPRTCALTPGQNFHLGLKRTSARIGLFLWVLLLNKIRWAKPGAEFWGPSHHIFRTIRDLRPIAPYSALFPACQLAAKMQLQPQLQLLD